MPRPLELTPIEAGTDFRSIRLWLNALLALCLRNRITIGAGLIGEEAPHGTTIASLPEEGFWLKLTSGGTGSKYAWTLTTDIAGGGWSDTTVTGGASSDYAYEANLNTTISTFPYYVRAKRGINTGEIRFRAAPC